MVIINIVQYLYNSIYKYKMQILCNNKCYPGKKKRDPIPWIMEKRGRKEIVA
jgi:hypothetical protein